MLTKCTQLPNGPRTGEVVLEELWRAFTEGIQWIACLRADRGCGVLGWERNQMVVCAKQAGLEDVEFSANAGIRNLLCVVVHFHEELCGVVASERVLDLVVRQLTRPKESARLEWISTCPELCAIVRRTTRGTVFSARMMKRLHKTPKPVHRLCEPSMFCLQDVGFAKLVTYSA